MHENKQIGKGKISVFIDWLLSLVALIYDIIFANKQFKEGKHILLLSFIIMSNVFMYRIYRFQNSFAIDMRYIYEYILYAFTTFIDIY